MRPLKVMLGAWLALSLVSATAAGDGELSASTFFRLPRSERADRFEALDLPAQYELYVHGVRNIEPPALELGTRIAHRGRQAVPFLSGILQAPVNDLDVRDAVYVLYAMDGLDLYRVKGDKDLISSIDKAIEGMGAGPWRESSAKMFDQMKKR